MAVYRLVAFWSALSLSLRCPECSKHLKTKVVKVPDIKGNPAKMFQAAARRLDRPVKHPPTSKNAKMSFRLRFKVYALPHVALNVRRPFSSAASLRQDLDNAAHDVLSLPRIGMLTSSHVLLD